MQAQDTAPATLPAIDPQTGWVVHQAASANPSKAYHWMHVMQEASARSVEHVGARPTIISREMHIVVTAMYDAWAAYDAKAVGTRLGGTLRRPAAQRTQANKERAIAYAAYRALLAVYPEDAAWLAAQMKAEGHDPGEFRPGPPPKVGSEQLRKEVDECIASNGHLTHEQKSIVEFMRDGPRSTGQSGHWLRFAADVSRRDRLTLDQDVKIFFAVGNIVFDAFISCWETKRYYDSARPWTLVRHYYKGQNVVGYAGPCKGFATIPAEQWHPYSPAAFVTPPFPGYTSGHATASGAAAKILELFTGSDRFEAVGIRACGELT